MGQQGTSRIHRRLVDSLYVEAMLLADEARAYFDEAGREEREALEALDRVVFSCESLKVTTRLMHVIAWLLTQRAVAVGELSPGDALSPSRRLGEAPATDAATLSAMPRQAAAIIGTSIDLHRRVSRLDDSLDPPVVPVSPARSMIEKLAGAF
jgi:regulator of CtrA degradation